MEWFESLAAKGARVKALEQRPELLETELFYFEMYQVCGADLSNIKTFCQLYGFDNEQVLDSIKIIGLISNGVHNASNTT